jgi:hypothetical protein
MDTEETKEAVAIMLAYIDGKAIEYRSEGSPLWKETKRPAWDFHGNEYRIKPDPWEGEIWVHENGSAYVNVQNGNKNTMMLKQGFRLINVKETK